MERIESTKTNMKSTYIDQLGDLYEKMYQQQEDFHQQCHDRMTDIETQLEYIWVTTHSFPLPFNFPSSSHSPPLPPLPPPV